MIALKLENVSKYFLLYNNPKDRLKELIFRKPCHKKYWVLKNITFEVNKGEVLGIIGNNGAGKSTLLKIISRITPPSSGNLIINGKISPILELGMGFHPEFTGIENIFLSARLLGFSNKEIKKKLDFIIDFSELGEFINQPIKTYSSGMQVRLAFSIAISIDPDILVIDEALSVGDIYFQKKSLDKIIEFKKKQKTIIFCSHSMYHINNLCNRAIWIDNGIIRMEGKAMEVVDEYEKFLNNSYKEQDYETNQKELNFIAVIKSLKLDKEFYKKGDDIIGTIEYYNPKLYKLHFGFGIQKEGNTIYGSSTYIDKLPPLNSKSGKIKFVIPNSPFLEGKYQLLAGIFDETGNLLLDVKSTELLINKTTNEFGFIWIDHLWEL